MKSKLMTAALVAATFAAQVANACHILVTVACPNNGNSASGIKVCATSTTTGAAPTCGTTDNTGFVDLFTPGPDTYNVCVDATTLPANATLATLCQTITCVNPGVSVTFDLSGDLCTPPPPPSSACWLTGGGTIGEGKTPDYSYGGVVYPGCSPNAAEGGNWNVIDHEHSLHFQGQKIVVDDCMGVPDKAPRVPVNIIDFHGTGIISGIGGNTQPTVPVTFVGRAVDNGEPGHDRDMLYIQVVDPSTGNVVLQIGTSATVPAVVSTGNLQIHISSCGK